MDAREGGGEGDAVAAGEGPGHAGGGCHDGCGGEQEADEREDEEACCACFAVGGGVEDFEEGTGAGGDDVGESGDTAGYEEEDH